MSLKKENTEAVVLNSGAEIPDLEDPQTAGEPCDTTKEIIYRILVA